MACKHNLPLITNTLSWFAINSTVWLYRKDLCVYSGTVVWISSKYDLILQILIALPQEII